MQVAFRLRRRSTAAPASALLLLSQQTADLMRLYARLGYDPLPLVYLVADGFLLMLPRPTPQAFGGVVRLRNLADNLLLPVDADLVPVLLPDEAAGLVRRRGLIFLPGERVLEFDPAHPLPLAAVLRADPLRRGAWRTLPEPEPLAERLTEITLDQPEVSVDELPPTEEADGATKEAPPSDAGLPARVFGKAAFGAGRALTWLGKEFGLAGLAALGMRLMGAGLGWAPGLAESVLGRQEAALRELLRAFREGKVEEALRRALPLGDDRRGAGPTTSTNLPFHNLRYSLRDILGSSGGGGGIWRTEADLYQELAREYRQQAELAVRRGDYRRAAFIHGKLLHDYRAAAAVLSRGGLHRDAAALYLKKLDDPMAAAREYEAAGEIDHALSLYRRHKEHLRAAELLRRAGDEEQALEEYRRAADHLVTTHAGGGYYEAGELLRMRAGREDMALPYYETGWQMRPDGSPVPCAIRLTQAYAREEATEKLTALADTAAEYFGPPGYDVVAAEFYNELVRQADRLQRTDVRDDLRDRALTGLVRKIRQRVGSGASQPDLVSTMLGTSKVWPAPVVSDAQFAVRQATKSRRSPPTGSIRCSRVIIRAKTPTVRAVCQAALSGDIFIGFESGEVFCFRPTSGELTLVIEDSRPIRSLAATSDGNALVVLSSQIPESASLKSLVRHLTFDVTDNMFLAEWPKELCPALLEDGGRHVMGVRTNRGVELLQGPQLLRIDRWEWPVEGFDPGATFLRASTSQTRSGTAVLALCNREFIYWACDAEGLSTTRQCGGGWRPAPSLAGSAVCPVVSWLEKGPQGFELAGVDSAGCLYASDLRFVNEKLCEGSTKALSGEQPFLAAAILRPGVVAAVTQNAVHWLRRDSNGLHTLRTTNVSLPAPVACFRHHNSKELIVVCAEGTLVGVPMSA